MSEWTNPSQRIHCVVEMDKPLTVRRERWALVQGDKQANTIVAEVFQTAGKPFDLTGCTVTLTFVRPDHLAAPPITAEVNGNVAAATLTDACYRVSGRDNALMQIEMDGADRTILWLVGDVLANENDGMVDEEGVFPTPEEMLIIFQQVEQAKQDANSAALKANTASNNANNAATNANTAANNANKWATAETTATAISAESQPTVDVSEKDGKKLISFGIPAGKTPNITFRVSTGEPGTQVEITQRGTPEAPVVELTIPRGDTGAIDGIDYYEGNPSALGTASPGTANGVARGNHVHPTPSASDVGALDKGGTAVNASMLGGRAPEYYIQPRNLLDNSDFTNLVNQRGETSYTGNGSKTPAIDRWLTWETGTLTVNDGYITVSGADFVQYIDAKAMNLTKPHSAFACTTGGEIINLFHQYEDQSGLYVVALPAGYDFLWAVLYEGAYTAETLPPYVPKGYEVELAECKKYFENVDYRGVFSKPDYLKEYAYAPVVYSNKRITPTIEVKELWCPGYYNMAQLSPIGFRDIQRNATSLTTTLLTAEGTFFDANLHVSADL